MNVTFFFKKTPIVFFFLLCFVISFNYAEAGRSVRLKKVRTHLAPRHISLLARSGSGIYARKYVYGRPIPTYSTKPKIGKNRRNYSSRSGNGRRRYPQRTYASGYRNWTPNNIHDGSNNPRTDKINPQKKRKDLLPFLIEPSLGSFKRKRRVRPNSLNAMQKPRPPKKPSEFDEEYYFPEEAKRMETKYEFENRYPLLKKKRRPEFEQTYIPDYSLKIPFYDDKRLPYGSKTREPLFSYSSFIEHPSGSLEEPEDYYEDQEDVYSKPVRKKKKRVKKKSNARKKNKDQYKPFIFESDQSSENYPPYLIQDDYELPTKTYRKWNKPNYNPQFDEDDFTSNKHSYVKQKPANNLLSTDSDFRGSHISQNAQFSPSYSQTWSNVVQTTAHPIQYQTDSGFQPQQYVPSQYNYKDYPNLQKTKTVTQQGYYSQPDNIYKSIAYSNNNKVTSTPVQTQNSYGSYSSQTSYSQPLPSSSSVLTDVTIQKSVPIYDNTETFYNFNNNAYVNSQSSKSYGSGSATNSGSQSFGTRLPSSSGHRNKIGDKTDSDSEFMKKHQNLYNNGLNGVPVQGDGYAKESVKKDYDIGYGDFQFDENPNH